jgi:hypothetical protein
MCDKRSPKSQSGAISNLSETVSANIIGSYSLATNKNAAMNNGSVVVFTASYRSTMVEYPSQDLKIVGSYLAAVTERDGKEVYNC